MGCLFGSRRKSSWQTTHGNPNKQKVTMTNDEAEVLLKELSEHYKQPVMPIKKYCAAIETWMDAIRDGVRRRTDHPEYQHGFDYHNHLSHISLDIQKSGLLARLLYAGEELRTEMCPVHQGHMDTALWCGFPDVPEGCKCDGSGWIPK